jgi:hypothetical protein
MQSLPHLLRFLAILSVVFFGANFDAGAAERAGSVTKVVSPAQVGSGTAAVGTPVYMGQRLRTGPKGRMQVTFSDQSVLTLGENANIAIDRFVYNPSKSTGELAVSASRGAFRFVGGKIEKMDKKKVTLNSPQAAMAVRGTDFWAGPIDGQYGVLLLKGKVGVNSRGRSVTLDRPYYGTDIPMRRKR